jgi:hypothetical protein
MNWAADINLSKDYKTLYGVPTEYLNIAEDGSLIRPSTLVTEANLTNTYQKKDGTYIQRRVYSENPDIMSARDEYLRNGGVNLEQVAYLPEKLDMKALKNKADKRSQAEEERLEKVSSDFFKVNHDPKAPAETQQSMDEKYNSINAAFNRRPKDYVLSVVESAKDANRLAAEEKGEHVIGGAFAQYINTTLVSELKQEGLTEFQKKMILCKGLAAAKFEAEGVAYGDDKIALARIQMEAKKIKENPAIDDMNLDGVMTILEQPKLVPALTGAYKDVENGLFKVEPKHYDGYFRELQTLKENMMSKEGRSKEYGRYYDAIDNAAKLSENRNDPDLANKIALANKEILESVESYTKGKKSVRHSVDGQARFDNSMDGLSIVSIYAPKGCEARAEKLLARVNEVRGLEKGAKLIMNDFGAENAQKTAQRMHIQANVPKK